VYQITAADDLTEGQVQHLLKGVVLDDDPKPCFAKACVQRSNRVLEMTIVEGRYHQVKRMMAAVGNHVAQLHRLSIGEYTLAPDLSEGEWRWLYPEDLRQLSVSLADS
jgi:16S rRNA pseudouridine516 synthase